MQYNQSLNTIDKEISRIQKIFKECGQVLKTEKNYSGMSLEELSIFYDEIENGLISYNLLINLGEKDGSENFKKMAVVLRTKDSLTGKFLEAQLLSVVVNMILKNHPSHNVPEKFNGSLWNSKLKDKEYYNQIAEIAGILTEYRENLYDFLHKDRM